MRSTFISLVLLGLPAAAQVAYDGKNYNGGGYGAGPTPTVAGSSSVVNGPAYTGTYSGYSNLPRQDYWTSRAYPWASYTPYGSYYSGFRPWRGGPAYDASGLRTYRAGQRLDNAIESGLQLETSATDPQRRILGITSANLPASPNTAQPLSPPARGDAQTATLRIPPFTAPSTQPVPEPGQIASKQPAVRPAGLEQLPGTLTELRTIRYQNDPNAHMVAQLESSDGWRFLADLGAVDQLTTLQPTRGMSLQVIGHEGQINGQRALFAQLINAPDQSLSIRNNFPPASASPAAPAKRSAPPTSPGESDQK